jgi:hypothetical protein
MVAAKLYNRYHGDSHLRIHVLVIHLQLSIAAPANLTHGVQSTTSSATLLTGLSSCSRAAFPGLLCCAAQIKEGSWFNDASGERRTRVTQYHDVIGGVTGRSANNGCWIFSKSRCYVITYAITYVTQKPLWQVAV